MKNRGSTRVRLRPGVWVKKMLVLACTAMVGLTLTGPALAATPGDPFNLGRVGYMFQGEVPNGPQLFWAGSQYRLNGVWQWCVNEDLNPPHSDTDSFVAAGTLDTPSVKVSGYEVTTSQMAWLLGKYNSSNDPVTLAGLSVLIHANFEQPDRNGYPSANSGVRSAQELAKYYVSSAEKALPEVTAKAKALATEAINAGVTGYTTNTVAGKDQRNGTVTGFAFKNAEGAYIPGINVSVTLTGPAVWDETNSATLNFKTANSVIAKKWHSTGNGTVSYKWRYQDPSGQLQRLARTDSQDTVRWDAARKEVTVPGSSWRVVFDFRPVGVSHAVKVVDSGRLTDSFVAQADPAYGDGSWVKAVDGSFVPVVYRASAYFVSPIVAPAVAASVPATARLVKSMTVTATGPGQELTADAGVASQPGFYTWVWEVRAGDQQAAAAPVIRAGWMDGFGKPDETSSVRYEAQVDSTLSVRETKSGTYLVDDVWVRGLPSNHPDFKGGAGFAADTGVITHRVVFFPQGLDVTDKNLDQAIQIGQSVQIPAKNGFYPSVGDESWLAKQNPDGTLVAGTYVFISDFVGDDRVKPLATSVEDVTEQFPVAGVHTTLLYEDMRGLAPALGTVKLTDKVVYTNLQIGKKYTITGTLMDKATGKPLVVKGKPVTASTELVAPSRNGSVDVTFEVPGSLVEGKTTVAFEKMLYEGKQIAVHADLEDENQTITITKIRTLAADIDDGDQRVEPVKKARITDKVCDESGSLRVGETYAITTTLMDHHTGKPLLGADGKPVTVHTKWSPKKADDCAIVDIVFDASTLAGKKIVVFEDVYRGGKLIGLHHDLNNKKQTIEVIEHKPVTTATDQHDGDQRIKPVKDARITDKVCDGAKSWTAGREYEITTSLVSSDGKPLLGADGKPVTVHTKWSPKKADDCVSITIPFDASTLAGAKVVVFEDVRYGGDLVGVHHDLKDKKQTIEVEQPPAPPSLPQTGGTLTGITALAGAILAGGIGAVVLRRRFSLM